jgi:hypothetical protein
MATFLSLCQDVGTDSGLISYQNRPATVVGALGKWADIVSFTAQAWRGIQRARQEWEFMRGDFSHALVIGQSSYLPADLGISSRFARFANDVLVDGLFPMRCFDPALGEADNQNLRQISPECWSMIYGRGAQTNQRPTDYALANSKLYVGAPPDKAYTVKGAYWKAPQTLALDADVPDLPEQFHEIIKWRAIIKVSGKDGAFTDRSVAQAEYSPLFRQLVKEQTRRVVLGGTLA